jgi:two-component system response regulator PilR (NtrC family)
MSKGQALVVDDETDILDLIRITLGRMGIDCTCAGDLAEARRLLATRSFDLCLTDMRLPDGSGIDLVRDIGEQRPELPVAMITAHGNMESAVAAMKAGAFDFVAKPLDLQVLRRLVESALRLRSTPEPAPASEPQGHSGLLGDSPPMKTLRQMIAKLARNQAPVFITGESGTGKELAARLIHALGPRAGRPFVPVNCGAIPHDLVESELFGHRKGSFTGAVSDKEGLFQAADGGTLFLDEVADLPLGMQVKLLRAIQEKSIRPVGAQRELAVDVRIISASHRDLSTEVEKGAFRQDLFYRINVIELRIPPLRERSGDAALLAEHILTRLAEREGSTPRALSAEALTALNLYPFPGNVRELENLLERACALCEGQRIRVEDLRLPVTSGSAASPAPVTAPAHPQAPDPQMPSADGDDGQEERSRILRTLDDTRWNRSEAARRLGMTLRQLRYRLQKWGVE